MLKEKKSIKIAYNSLRNKFLTETNTKIVVSLVIVSIIMIITINTLGAGYLDYGIKSGAIKQVIFRSEIAYHLTISYFIYFLLAFLYYKFIIYDDKKAKQSDKIFIVSLAWIMFYAASFLYFIIKYIFFINPIKDKFMNYSIISISVTHYVFLFSIFYFAQLLFYNIILMSIYNLNPKIMNSFKMQMSGEDYILKFSLSNIRKNRVIKKQALRKTLLLLIIIIYISSMFDFNFLIMKINRSLTIIETTDTEAE